VAAQRDPWRAWRPGDDPRALAQAAARARDAFLAGDRGTRTADSADAPGAQVRSVVWDSWRRSRDSGVDPDSLAAPALLDPAELADYRDAHPLAGIMAVVRSLLVADALDSGLIVAVTDADGRLLWVEGEPGARRAAEQMHFVEGARWSEEIAGTNAPALALRMDHRVQVFAAEHFQRVAQPWSCSAAPVHDPITGDLLGAIDITGGDQVAAPQILSLVGAAAAAAEAELRILALAGRSAAGPRRSAIPGRRAASGPESPAADAPDGPGDAPRLQTLGVRRPALARGSRLQPLSLRHGEILLLLHGRPQGMSADELATALADRELDTVTVRAEMSRLRRVLGDDALISRPYRLAGALTCDAAQVRRLLERGAHRAAATAYLGPILPLSGSPAVAEARDELHGLVRRAVLRSGDPELLLQWCSRPHGADDVPAWEAALVALPKGSPRRESARAGLDAADRRLAGT
jgi:hypothetical protein